MFMKYLTILLAVLLVFGDLVAQKPGSRTPPPKNKGSEALIDAGDKLADERKWNEAIDAYLLATRVDPQNADAYVGLGDAYMGAGKWTEALVAYKKAVALDPQNADAQYALGDASNTMRMHGDAFAPLVKAIQLDPTFAEAYYGIGYAYLAGQQYEKSLSFLNSAIRLKPDYEDAHYGLAVAYLNLGNRKGLDDERKRLVTLNSALVKKLDSDIDKFKPAISEALASSGALQSVADTPRASELTKQGSPTAVLSAKKKAAAPDNPRSFELAFWESIKNSKDPEDFNYYLRKYPNGKFAALARIKTGKRNSSAPTISPSATPSAAGLASRPRVASKQNPSGQRPELAIVTGHSAPISAIAFGLDGSTVATGDGGGAIKLWDALSGEGLRMFTEAESVGAGIREALESNTFPANTPEVSSLAFSYDGKLLAGALVRTPDKETHPNAKPQAEIAIWDIASGSLVRNLSGINFNVKAIAFSPDGKWLVSGGLSNLVTVWDVRTGTKLRSFSGHVSVVNSVIFTTETEVQSGNWDRSVDVWNAASGTPLREIPGNPTPTLNKGLTGFTEVFPSQTIFNSTTRRYASINPGSIGSNHSIILRDGATSRVLREFKRDNETPVAMALSVSGKIIAGGNISGSIQLWDVDSGRTLLSIKNGFSSEIIAMSPDSTTIAQLTEDEKSIKLWDTHNQTTMKGLSGHTDDINTLVFSPDSQILASGGWDKTIRLWDLKGGGVKVLEGHTDSVGSIAFHPNGTMLASIADNIDSEGPEDVEVDDNTIRFWEVGTGKALGALPDTSIPLSLAFSPDGAVLAIGNRDGTIALLDLSGKTAPRALPAKNGQVGSMAFMDRDTLQSLGMSADETNVVINLWQVSSGQLLRSNTLSQTDTSSYKEKFAMSSMPFMALSQSFYAMPIKGNSLTLFSRTTAEIDPVSQPELATLYLLDDNDWLITTPDGLFDGSPGAWPRAIWRFNKSTLDHAPVESFFNEFYYPGLLSDILAGKQPRAPSDISQKDRRQPQLRVAADTQGNANITTRSLRVRIDVLQAAAGAQDVRLFRNGSLAKVWHGDVMKGQSSVTLEAAIPIVAGENKLTVYAFNQDNIKSTDVTLTVTGADNLKRKGVAYVLAVGVNEYANPEYNLKYAVADAQAFAAEFETQQTKLKTYERVALIPLNDREATKGNILKALTELSSTVQPEDALIIYFAGHGTAQDNRFYLIPHDLGAPGAGLQTILSRSISDNELKQAVEGIDAGQMLLVIDACNSGQALESEDKRRGPMNSKGLAQFGYDKGMYILTAAQSYQAAMEAARLGHGFLTYALVEEGLKTDAADRSPSDGRVVLREWLDYATRRVPQMQRDELDAQKKQGRQLDRIKFAEADSGTERGIQRPRVFYRREMETHPLVVSTVSGYVPTPNTSASVLGNAGEARKLPDQNSTVTIGNSVIGSSPDFGTSVANVTPETIESKYQLGLVDEVISDSRKFLRLQPDNAKVNTILGFVLLTQQKDSEAFVYLDKGFLGGEPITTNVRRHRLIGPLLQDGSIEMTVNGLAMRYGTESYRAPFSAITSFDARTYGQSGTGIFIQGKFLNQKGKEEKKEFKLFATSATIRQVPNGLGTMPIVYCQNCEAWSLFTVRLFSHLQTVPIPTNPKSESFESTEAITKGESGGSYKDNANVLRTSSGPEQVFNVSHAHVGLITSMVFPGLLYVSPAGIRFLETAAGGNVNDNFIASCQDIKELSLRDSKLKQEYKRANCRYLHVKIAGRNYNFEADTLSTCLQGSQRTPEIVKAIADACGITPR